MTRCAACAATSGPIGRVRTGLDAARRVLSGRRGDAASDRGFTLIESLAAAGILLIIAGGIITTLIATANWYAKARLRTQAYAVANQVMATILSRNYSDIHFATAGENYPDGIPASMSWPPRSMGRQQFTVVTSMETTTDPKTGLEMKQIAVSALPVAQSLDPTVTVTRFASGWQQVASSTQKFLVSVEVHLTPRVVTDLPLGAGARVELLDPNTMSEAYFATTDDSGVAHFYNVVEGQYYLTCDPRFGTDIRPVFFPMRISPTHGGSANNPIMPVNSYDLLVTKSPIGASLHVGAYDTEGWTVVENVAGIPVAVAPEVPYRYPAGLVVYAKPVLNSGSSGQTELYGMGENLLYPSEAKLPVYSGTVNAYGVATISIPWIVDSNTQYWRIWCRTRDASGQVTEHTLTTTVSGAWDSRVQRPEGAFTVPANYGNIVQFSRLGVGTTAVNDPTVPDSLKLDGE